VDGDRRRMEFARLLQQPNLLPGQWRCDESVFDHKRGHRIHTGFAAPPPASDSPAATRPFRQRHPITGLPGSFRLTLTSSKRPAGVARLQRGQTSLWELYNSSQNWARGQSRRRCEDGSGGHRGRKVMSALNTALSVYGQAIFLSTPAISAGGRRVHQFRERDAG